MKCCQRHREVFSRSREFQTEVKCFSIVLSLASYRVHPQPNDDNGINFVFVIVVLCREWIQSQRDFRKLSAFREKFYQRFGKLHRQPGKCSTTAEKKTFEL